ncbi:MAG: META domain-containing protein [Muribaculaceae bacterium]|nr:META domain-containing protein [Muribaculaceae bacterium]
MKIKTIIISALIVAVGLYPTESFAKKKQKYEKRIVSIADSVKASAPTPQPVVVTDPGHQLYGEWNILTLKKKKVVTPTRAYIYLDFNGGRVYGNNGCNVINGTFTVNGNSMKLSNFISTETPCHSTTSERSIMKGLEEVASFKLSRLYNMDYMDLLNSRGNVVMSLRRQNLDFLNGPWIVKEINTNNVTEHNIRLVIDAVMQTIHISTGCNIISGAVNIDTSKEFAIQFEDLSPTRNSCPDRTETETDLLIALEQTELCKRINDNEMALMNNKGAIVLVITRTRLR